MRQRLSAVAASVLLASASTSAAWAADSSADSSGPELEEVKVVARRQQESEQKPAPEAQHPAKRVKLEM